MMPDDEMMEALAWLQEERSLSEICQRFPDTWVAIKQEMLDKARPNRINRFLIQRLLFDVNGGRKTVPLSRFRLVWPLIWQRRLFLRATELQGIYCFYSKELIEGLAKLIGPKPCLEIAAGDGTLARLLKVEGVDIIATDNRSWDFAIRYPDAVVQCNAEKALRRYAPETVICSWPPRGNDFERQVLATASVQTYIVVSSHLESASGDWTTYRQQAAFSFEEAKGLSALAIPPELKPAVYIFRRKTLFNDTGETQDG